MFPAFRHLVHGGGARESRRWRASRSFSYLVRCCASYFAKARVG